MSDSISTLLTRNLDDVFGENDPARAYAHSADRRDARGDRHDAQDQQGEDTHF